MTRLAELEIRRRTLILRSERLRNDLAADQQVLTESLQGFQKAFMIARGAVGVLRSPLVLGLLGLLGFGAVRGARPMRLAMRGMVWVSLVRRLLPLVGLVRAFIQSRRRSHASAE